VPHSQQTSQGAQNTGYALIRHPWEIIIKSARVLNYSIIRRAPCPTAVGILPTLALAL
jgi:hypothetical protein